MRCFLIFTIVSVASCAPGLDHSGGGGGITSTLAPFASGPGSGIYAGGHGGYAGGHGGYAGGHGGYAGGHGGYAGGHGGYLGGGSGSFGGSLGGFSGFGPSGAGFTGSGHGGHGYGGGFGGSQGFNGGGGFSGGIIDGHLTAGSINGGLFGGFASGSDGHITAGGGSGCFGGGLDGHLTAGGNIGGGGSIGGPGPIGGAGPIGGSGIAIDGVAGGGYDQGPIVTKDFFFHAAADDIEDEVVSKTINLGPSRKHYRVVFIKAPSQSAKSAALQILQGQNEEKTVIYVLSKKTDGADIHAEIQGYKHTPSKPEVFFIKYKTPEEAIHAQQKIQAQYDSLGGTSRFSDEGISPVTSVIGSVNQGGPVGLAGGHGNGGSAAFIGDSSTGVVGGSNLGGHHGHGVEGNLGASLGGHHGHGGVEAGLSGSHGNTHTGDAGYLPPIKK